MPAALLAGLPQLIGSIPGLLGSLFGAGASGQTAINQANAALLKQILAAYNQAAPVRQGLQTSMLGRLPDYMRANFPRVGPPTASDPAASFRNPGGRPNDPYAPQFPRY